MRVNYNRRGVTALDVVLVIGIILIGLVSLFFINKETKVPRDVVITVNSDEYASVPLQEERVEIKIEEKGMVVVIANNKVVVEESTCKDKTCVKHKPIVSEGQSIVCAPNKVIVEIKSNAGLYNAAW